MLKLKSLSNSMKNAFRVLCEHILLYNSGDIRNLRRTIQIRFVPSQSVKR